MVLRTKTSVGNETVSETVNRAKAMLSSIKTKTPTSTKTTSGGGTSGLTSTQKINEQNAQTTRFNTVPTNGGANTSGFDSLKDLSIKNSPVVTTPTPIKRTIKTSTVSATPDFYEEAYKDTSREAQKRINSINSFAAEKLKSLQPRQEERLRETSSINSLTGLGGSNEANITTEKTAAVNKQESDLVRAEAETQVATILDGLSTKALERATFERESFTAEAEKTAAEKAARIEEDTNQAITLAASGVSAEALKAQNPEEYQYLADSLGGEEMLKATFTLNRPVESILDKKIEGGKYVIAFQNPIDGKIRIETVDLGLPAQYTKTIDAGNRILAIPDDWDGSPESLITINKGLTPGQQSSSNDVNDQLYSGLSSTTATAVRSKVSKFSSEPIVQNFATIQEGHNFAQSIDTKTQNPADDQALIYSLAKALDPGSVVREGEYATAQKYAQSWIQAFGKGVEQALLGTGFLSETARANIKNTIEQKYQSSLKSYANVANQYKGNIDNLTGRGDGERFLVDYQTPEVVDQSEVGADQVEVRSPDGQWGYIPQEQLSEALAAGYVQQSDR